MLGKNQQNAAHAGDDAVHYQGVEQRRHMERLQPGGHPAGNHVQPQLEVAFQPVAHRKGEEEHQGHNAQEDGQAPNPVSQQLVGLVGDGLLGGLVHQHLLDDLVDEVILLVDDVLLVAAVQHLGQIHG